MNELSRRIGKFDSPESLLKAYNSLLAEFTKRCQRLKECEKEAADLKAASEDESRLSEWVKTALRDPDFVAQNVLSDEGITTRVIEAYLEELNRPSAALLRGGNGAAVLTPPSRPKDLGEAKRLADIILNS